MSAGLAWALPGPARSEAAAAPSPHRKSRYLTSGELVVCREPTAITTVLGSCVAVCLWDPSSGVGAMNHYLLPGTGGAATASPRFGTGAIARLLERARELGCERPQAKLFGGARVLGGPPRANDVGAQNVGVAREALKQARIAIVAEDVGGDRGRRLVFQTDTGLALVKRL